jgi:hypothetical protein
MSADIEIPDKYTITLAGGTSLDLGDIHIKEIPTIKLETSIKEIPKITLDSKIDAGLDNIKVKELPRIDLDFGMKPTRVHIPLNLQFCVSVLGISLLKFAVCGEGMMITEPYIPHRAEHCE